MRVLIYLRRSKRDDNSLSIPSQEADCVAFVKARFPNAEYSIYTENGKSGKDIQHRPEFKKLLEEVKDGNIDWVVVKKLDRFMRSLQDYLDVVNILRDNQTNLYSICEGIDTSSKTTELLGILLAFFAQYEREAIADRVADAYAVRSHTKGFFQGGSNCYGYTTETRKIDGIEGSVLIPSEQAWVVKKLFEMYSQIGVSYADCIRFLREHSDEVFNETYKSIDPQTVCRILESPLYVRANAEVYQYLSAAGAELVDDISAYDGVHGLFAHNIYDYVTDEKGETHRTRVGYKGKNSYIKVGYHEGLVDADTWLAVQVKKETYKITRTRGDAKRSWLVGLVKCPYCKRSMKIIVDGKHNNKRYFSDTGLGRVQKCIRTSNKLKPDYVEEVVFEAMKNLLHSLKISATEKDRANPLIETLNAEITQIEIKIRRLVDSIADDELADVKYVRQRISELDTKKQQLEQEIFKLSKKNKGFEIKTLEEPLSHWSDLSIQEKNDIAKTVIDVIYVSDEHGIDIKFSIS